MPDAVPGAMPRNAEALDDYLGRLARRTLWFKVFRSVAFASASGALSVALCAAWVGPAVGAAGAVLAWSLVAVATGVAGAIGLGRVDELRGARRALLLRPLHPRLAARVRSAAELQSTPNGSRELLQAFTDGLLQELRALPVPNAAARPDGYGRMVLGALLCSVLAVLSLSLRDDLSSGLYALLHPGRAGQRGDAQGLWIGRLEVRLSQTTRGSEATRVLIDPRRIDVPEGTAISLSVTPRFGVERALAELGELKLPLSAEANGTLKVAFTAEKSSTLWLKAHVAGKWIEDSVPRELVVAQDGAPRVALNLPSGDVSAREDEPVQLAFRAEDDHGLASIDLVVQLGPGRERKLRLVSFGENELVPSHADGTELTPRAFGAQQGQTLAVWIEARDRDSYPQANVGRSEVRMIRVGEPVAEGGPDAPLEQLERARDQFLGELANRLESTFPASKESASARARTLSRGVRALLTTLDGLRQSYLDAARNQATRGALSDMAKRISRLLRDETASDDLNALRKLDGSFVAEQEDDTLWLTDLLGRERLGNAKAAIDRAQATQARMKQLLEELKRTGDPDKRSALLAELARARRELSEISRKLATAERDVPADFVNYDALRGMTNTDPLASLEKALADGDMQAAEKAMAALEEATKGLSRGVNEGGEAFADSRFAPRAAEAEQARAELRELSEGQNRLAGETGKISERQADQARVDSAHREQSKRLASAAEALEKRARVLPAHPRIPSEAEAQASASQRLRDARDALKQGDAREAQNMTERAVADLQQLSDDISMDARMFPGRDNQRTEAARRAEKLADDAQQLAQELERHVAPPPSALPENDSDNLRKQSPRQKALGELAQDLEQKMREKGPQGVSEGLSRAARSMRSAASALDRADLREAEAHQRDALEKLAELDDQLARQSNAQQQPQNGEPSRSGEQGQRTDSDERVTIPTEGEDARRAELRRRVLDARRAEPPSRFAKAVERYYQEILR